MAKYDRMLLDDTILTLVLPLLGKEGSSAVVQVCTELEAAGHVYLNEYASITYKTGKDAEDYASLATLLTKLCRTRSAPPVLTGHVPVAFLLQLFGKLRDAHIGSLGPHIHRMDVQKASSEQLQELRQQPPALLAGMSGLLLKIPDRSRTFRSLLHPLSNLVHLRVSGGRGPWTLLSSLLPPSLTSLHLGTFIVLNAPLLNVKVLNIQPYPTTLSQGMTFSAAFPGLVALNTASNLACQPSGPPLMVTPLCRWDLKDLPRLRGMCLTHVARLEEALLPASLEVLALDDCSGWRKLHHSGITTLMLRLRFPPTSEEKEEFEHSRLVARLPALQRVLVRWDSVAINCYRLGMAPVPRCRSFSYGTWRDDVSRLASVWDIVRAMV